MEFLKTLNQKADPAHAVLMVIDLQRGYWPPRPGHGGAAEVLPQLLPLIDAARQVSLPIIYVRNSFGPWVSLPAWEERWLYSIPDAGQYVQEGTPGLELAEGLGPRPGELVINKHFWSPFAHGPVDLVLRCRGVKTLLLTGGAVLGAIETTAKEAVVRGYYAVMVQDCIFPLEGPLGEVVYQYSQARLAQVVTARELMDVWTPPSPRLGRGG